jgi:hypothetical protein
MPTVLPIESSGAKNMKTGPDSLGTAEKMSKSENMKTGPDALGSAENESGSA